MRKRLRRRRDRREHRSVARRATTVARERLPLCREKSRANRAVLPGLALAPLEEEELRAAPTPFMGFVFLVAAKRRFAGAWPVVARLATCSASYHGPKESDCRCALLAKKIVTPMCAALDRTGVVPFQDGKFPSQLSEES